jgi:malate permease and related proteins
MAIATTIIPIFTIIALGWLARVKGFLPPEFIGPANRLVYYWAIPAMIFRSIYQSSFKALFNPTVLGIGLCCISGVFFIAWISAIFVGIKKKQMGSFIQSSFHGNLGYIGLAVSFYYLEADDFVKAGIMAGFIMILQNFLAVVILRIYSSDDAFRKMNFKSILSGIIASPVIISAMAGILVSIIELNIPTIIDNTLKILSGMALPLALILIGSSLSFNLINHQVFPLLFSCAMKLLLLPGAGLIMFIIFQEAPKDYLPCLILLASPTATLVYVMAQETKNDVEFAVATISMSTLLSGITFAFWIMLAV